MSLPSIPLVPENTTDPAAGLNQSLNLVKALVQTEVLSISLNAPPGSPSNDDMYIVSGTGGTATGAWAGHELDLARYVANGAFWVFYVAGVDVRQVVNRANGTLCVYQGNNSPAAWFEIEVVPTVDRSVVTELVPYLTDDGYQIDVDLALGDYFTLDMVQTIAEWNFLNLPGAGKGVTILIKIQKEDPSQVLNYPSSFRWVNGVVVDISDGTTETDLLALTTFDNGTTWQATLTKNFA